MTAAARRHSKRVGYVRVSTLDQNTERQLDGQELDKVFTDKAGPAYDLASGLGSVDVTQLVDSWNKATFTSTTTNLTINGATSPVSITHGEAVTLDATVAGVGGTAAGDVALISNANQQANTYGSDGLGFVTLSGGTTGPMSYSNLPGGMYSISANYGGDVTFSQSVSNAVQITVAKENSVLHLFGENGRGSPLMISGNYVYGTYFSLNAQPIGASQAGSSNPDHATGTITFADTAGPLPGSSSGSAAGVVAINSYGVAELPVYYWPPTAHSVSASYGGDNSFNASSTATPISFTITQAPTTNTVSSSASSVSSGTTYTITSLITPIPASRAAPPTGTVTLIANGGTIGTGTVTATHDLTGNSLATVAITFNASSLEIGANKITSNYSGDSNYSSSLGTVTLTSTATTSLTISSTSIMAITAGSSATSNVTLTPGGGFIGAVSLTCSITGPSGATSVPGCSLTPSSVNISGTTAGMSTLMVATTSTTIPGKYMATINAAVPGGVAAPPSTLTVTVNGGFALTSTAATISGPGMTGTSTITIIPTTNYTGTIGLGCVIVSQLSGANGVDNPTCTVSPNTARISSETPVTVTATVTTTAPASSRLAYPGTNHWLLAADGAALASFLFFGIPARRRGRASVFGLLVVLSAIAGIGCGKPSSVPGTRPGVYTFVVVGTDTVTATTTASTVFTVTVQ